MHERSAAIAAIATAPGRGAVGIVRVSGGEISAVVQGLCGRQLKPREATYLAFLDAASQPIDHGLAIYFPAPHSFTGEHVLELQAHGGPVVLQLLLARCLEAGAAGGSAASPVRLARPGEFTERAYLNNKLDLAQAEAVADLIDASTEAAARSATRAMAGVFSAEVQLLRERLIEVRMLVEAYLDFPEEGLGALQRQPIVDRLAQASSALATLRQRTQQGALLREGIKVVLAGQPNVGKSSLLNALAGAELAIVSPIAGTTRDKVAQSIQIEGVPVHVVDTAGLRPAHESGDEIEKIGMARAWGEVQSADVVIFLRDASRQQQPDYSAEDARLEGELAQKAGKSVPVLSVWNKTDLAEPAAITGIHLSAKTGVGLAQLRQRLLHLAGWEAEREDAFIARSRHVQALALTQQHLQAAWVYGEGLPDAMELLAEELRLAHNALGEITGAFSADELLGVIFSRFCIGK
ncbi:MAG: tRNA uridine-5-carboxymethylaminomethyl(34) synthesis GTPase MnmE [Burkholderiales bacterium]